MLQLVIAVVETGKVFLDRQFRRLLEIGVNTVTEGVERLPEDLISGTVKPGVFVQFDATAPEFIEQTTFSNARANA